jgi:glucosamine--fructose-6-phosphate aminotransferase (isomerizing)
MSLESDIFEQPKVLANLLKSQAEVIRKVVRETREKDVDYVFLAARGSSDNAGRYAQYLWGAQNGLPIALATPSLFTYYQQPPRLNRALVIGISQSGMSPDIVSVLAEGRRQGRPTLAITNDVNSPLAEVADMVIDIQAGEEKAVAATKTYTTSLMVVAMISAALSGTGEMDTVLNAVPGWTAQMLDQDEKIARIAERYLFMNQSVVLGRGFNYATAFEWALKMKELTYVGAEPYSSADFLHGPIAVVGQGFPVMAVAPSGQLFGSLMEVLATLRNERKAELMVVSDRPEALALAQSPVCLPENMPEWVTPIVSIIAGQLFAYHLTQTKGLSTEAPRGLHKVTETQ